MDNNKTDFEVTGQTGWHTWTGFRAWGVLCWAVINMVIHFWVP